MWGGGGGLPLLASSFHEVPRCAGARPPSATDGIRLAEKGGTVSGSTYRVSRRGTDPYVQTPRMLGPGCARKDYHTSK